MQRAQRARWWFWMLLGVGAMACDRGPVAGPVPVPVPVPRDAASIDLGDREVAEVGPDAPAIIAEPGVGLMHTADQLREIRARRALEPWSTALWALLAEADAALERTPAPVEDLHVPPYYQDPQGHEAAKRAIADDGYAAYALALAYQLAAAPEQGERYAAKAVEILDAWARVNRTVSGDDGTLVMVYKGVHLLYAGDLVARWPGWDPAAQASFRAWVGSTFRAAADDKKGDANNHGAWGTFGAIATAAILQETVHLEEEIERVRVRIRDSIDENGELPAENRRTNSGMWYSYFALAPVTGSAQIARNVHGVDLFHYVAPSGRSIRQALDRLFFYSQHPEQWPYPLPAGALGDLWRVLYPCADEVELPTPTAWPGNLFEAMADEYGARDWSAWVAPYRPQRGGHVWIYPTLSVRSP